MGLKEQREKQDWKGFFLFLKKGRISWWLILLTVAISMAQMETIVNMTEYTSMLYNGDFTMYVLLHMLFFMMLSFVSGQLVTLLRVFAGGRSLQNVRNVVWKKMLHISSGAFLEERPEYLLSAITNDAKNAVDGIVTFIINVVSSIYSVVRVLMTMNKYNTKLMLSLLLLIPFHIVYGVLVGRWRYRTNHRIQKRIGNITAYMAERIRNLELIKVFTNEEKEGTKGAQTVESLYKARRQSAFLDGVGTAYVSVSNILSVVVAVLWGSFLMKRGEIQRDAWMAFFIFVPTLGAQLQAMVSYWLNAKSVQGNAARMAHILTMPLETKVWGTERKAFRNGAIHFSNISFRYGETCVLSDVSFTVPEGKVTAIVGTSGSGKTTLLNLLEKIYAPESGEITVGGIDIAELGIAAYRSHLAYIPQDAGVFSGTVREILTYGVSRQVTDEELTEVTKAAGIYEYIEKQPQGFDSRIELWGSSVSGGQRQKLVIARELLRESDILLLDEPTSALDAQATREVWQTLSEVFHGKTMVIVTHDLSIAAKADQVVLLNQGRIEGSGTHEEVLRYSDLYRDMVQEQSFQEVYGDEK